jgi:hypothetical protein
VGCGRNGKEARAAVRKSNVTKIKLGNYRVMKAYRATTDNLRDVTLNGDWDLIHHVYENQLLPMDDPLTKQLAAFFEYLGYNRRF